MSSESQITVDVAIVGAGICGLWLAVKLVRAGYSVCLIDKSHAGAGASGGVLGALMPHMPERWNEKKEFQFQALHQLSQDISHLESRTGLDAGYRRLGRVLPLHSSAAHAIAIDRQEQAANLWRSSETGYRFQVVECGAEVEMFDPKMVEFGVVHETFAARVAPRKLLAALLEDFTSANSAIWKPGSLVTAIDSESGRIDLADRTSIHADRCVIAAGHQSFDFIAPLAHLKPSLLGQAHKGQAALLKANVPEDRPMLFHDGAYIVPHDNQLFAVGSTSERQFADPLSTDERLEVLIAKARTMAPFLRDAEVIEKWAGLRPRAIGIDPMVGPIPGADRVISLTGGYKITFGIAHRLADCVLNMICNPQRNDADQPALPDTFRIENHLKKAEQL